MIYSTPGLIATRQLTFWSVLGQDTEPQIAPDAEPSVYGRVWMVSRGQPVAELMNDINRFLRGMVE